MERGFKRVREREMGPQGNKLVVGSQTRYTSIPSSLDTVEQQQQHGVGVKERLLSSNGSVSGSPGRLIHDNVSRDSGIGGLKVTASHLYSMFSLNVHSMQ